MRVTSLITATAVYVLLSAAPAHAQQVATARVFEGGDSPSPFDVFHTDWASGYYKAQCGNGGPAVGLSAWGPAHAMLCKSPLAVGAPLRYQDTSAIPEQVQTFASSDSAGYGTRGDWDYGYFKGECSATGNYGDFVIGVAQTTSGQIEHLLCGFHAGADFLRAGASCHTRTFSGTDDPPSLPDGDWDPYYLKLACDAGEVIAGISADPSTHEPHAILCCDLQLVIG